MLEDLFKSNENSSLCQFAFTRMLQFPQGARAHESPDIRTKKRYPAESAGYLGLFLSIETPLAADITVAAYAPSVTCAFIAADLRALASLELSQIRA